MYFKDEITDILPLDKEHRRKWFQATGLLMGLNVEESQKTLDIFNELLDNWELYKKYNEIYEYMLPMLRRAISYLYSDECIIWSIKSDKKRLEVYRLNFNLLEYIDHFNNLFIKNKVSFIDNFVNIDAEAELCHLCIRDYFYHLSKISSSEDYLSILREKRINNILDE